MHSSTKRDPIAAMFAEIKRDQLDEVIKLVGISGKQEGVSGFQRTKKELIRPPPEDRRVRHGDIYILPDMAQL